MKIRHIITILIGLLLGTAGVYAQTIHNYPDVKGNLTPFTVKANNKAILKLTGDVTISSTDQIIIEDKGELIIINETSSAKTIKNTSSSPEGGRFSMFLVHSGGKLTIDGGSSGIIIDAGANLQGTPGTYTHDLSKRFRKAMIATCGTLDLNNVTIRNFCAINNDASTIAVVPYYQYDGGANKTCGTTTINNCLIENCKGYIGTFMQVGSGTDYLASSVTAESCKIVISDCTIRNCEVLCDENGWGGAIRCRGGSYNNMYLTNTVFTGNYSHGDGPTLWWNAGGRDNTKCLIDGCSFTNNTTMRDAGGLRLEGTFEFLGNKTIVSGNTCHGLNDARFNAVDRVLGNGGGIQIYGYAGSQDAIGGTLTYRLPGCLEVKNNTAKSYGGGIAFEFNSNSLREGTHIDANFDGVEISNNSAGIFGGGVYMRNSTNPIKNYTFKVELNSGTIEDNESPNGGGMYIRDLNVGSHDGGASALYIQNNTAVKTSGENTGNGGGIYLHYGNLDLQRTNITGNKALNGGGLFVYHGSFTSSTGSVVSNNTCDEYGGGVFIYNNIGNTNNTTDNRDIITLTAGTINNNTGKYGGGLAAYGNIELTMFNTSVESNTAEIGGGLFAYGLKPGSGVVVHYKSGLIRYNKAIKAGPITTAFGENDVNDHYKEISGVGGGIYMGRYTHLDFRDPSTQQLTKDVGIYSNRASNGADDLFGYNQNVYLLLPNISELELSGFNEQTVTNLYWVEDYVTADTHYKDGLKIGSEPNQRYRDVIEGAVQGHYYSVNFGTNESEKTYTNKYLCLAIGWNVNRITLVKEGMKDGENAIFNIYKDGLLHMTVMLTDEDKQPDGSRSKIIELNDGEYRIVETNWSWAYTPSESEITRTINIGSEEADRTFTFINTPNSSAPIHSEDLKINKIRIN